MDLADTKVLIFKERYFMKRVWLVPAILVVLATLTGCVPLSVKISNADRKVELAELIQINKDLIKNNKVRADELKNRRSEIKEHNEDLNVDTDSLINGRRITNLGAFRSYLVQYLRNHPMIHKDMTFLVRQLAPTDRGIPLEIYVFSRDKAWANYENIQADIFDHVIAAAPEFDLAVFQSPSGRDFRNLSLKDTVSKTEH